MATTAPDSTTSSTLSAWAGPYVTDMLGKTQALANEGYQQYTGPLTAGPSALQQQAFQGIAGLTVPQANSFTPASFDPGYTAGKTNTNYNTGTFSSFLPGTSSANPYGVGSVQDYMNPYLQGVLDPQIREANRQAQISQMQNADRFAKAGAYGGSRQAIMDAELQRNLLQSVGDMTGKTYATAYDKALDQQYKTAGLGMDAQKMAEQSRQFGANFGLDAFKANEEAARQQGLLGLDAQKAGEQSYQFGANYGLDASKMGLAALEAQMKAGQVQRDIEQQGLTADYNEFAQQREHPYDQLKFMREMITGMPISTTTNTSAGASSSQNIAGLLAALNEMFGS